LFIATFLTLVVEVGQRFILNEGKADAMNFYLTRLQEAIGACLREVEGHEPGSPREGKWSAAEILEHLYLTYTGTIKGFERCLEAGKPLARVPTLKDRMKTCVVVGLGHMPEGRKAPKNSTPRGLPRQQVRDEIVGKIAAMNAIIAQAEHKYGRDTRLLDHPILGPLRGREWRKFHWVHGMHHVRQIERLRKGAAKAT
jgi:hypothetical protein